MSGNKQATAPAVAKADTALTAAHSGWLSASISARGLAKIVTLTEYTWSSATSIELAMQANDAEDGSGTWHDVHGAAEGVSALDEVSLAVTASVNVAHTWDVEAFNYVRFTAKRTGGSASDTAAMDWCGV